MRVSVFRKYLFSSQFVFIILASVLLAFTIFQHKKNKETKEQEKEASLVFDSSFKIKDVQYISIKNIGGWSFILEKTKDQWMLKSPIQEFASALKVEDLIGRIFNQEASLVLNEDISWSEYDLKPPFCVIEIRTANQKKSVGVSSKPNYEGNFYIQSEQKLLLGSSQWERFSQLRDQDYISKKLYHFSQNPTQFTYKTSTVEYTFKRNNNQWEWIGKKLFPLSQKAIENWLKLFRQDIISSFTNNKKSVEEKKYLKADLTVKFTFENQSSPWFLKLQSVPEAKDQVIVSDRSYVYELKNKNSLMTVDFQDHPKEEKNSTSKIP